MQSSKRTLRSHEIPVPLSVLALATAPGIGTTNSTFGSAGGGVGGGASTGTNNIGSVGGGPTSNGTPLLETDLDLHFSLQYPHFIKRDGNRLVFYLLNFQQSRTYNCLSLDCL